MLPLICILVGLILSVSYSLLLWYMLTRPTKWARFTEKEHDFWIKRGLLVKWAGAVKECEQSRFYKSLVAFGILWAAVLVLAPFVFPLFLPRHG